MIFRLVKIYIAVSAVVWFIIGVGIGIHSVPH
jgi:hypothetical protein